MKGRNNNTLQMLSNISYSHCLFMRCCLPVCSKYSTVYFGHGNERHNPLVVRRYAITCQYPQNVDIPADMPKTKKKPFKVPVRELRRAARWRQKKSGVRSPRSIGPPKNGLLVPELIPVAHQVFEARTLLMNSVAELLKVIPAYTCRECFEVHVGPVGHPFTTCKGTHRLSRNLLHDWGDCYLEDIVVSLDAYHLFDRLAKRLNHDERYSVERIPAVVELCIQAGLDLPQYCTRRRVEPVFYFGKELFDPNEDEAVYDMKSSLSGEVINLYEPTVKNNSSSPSMEEAKMLAEDALEAWSTMRKGVAKLMKKYKVKVCGYCPEVHVGPVGHRAKLCSGYKYQRRNGRHGWQSAGVDDILPPKYVWHVPDPYGSPLKNELKKFYGQAPAVVELCVQAGAAIPEEFKPMMRLDIIIPESSEEENLAA